jgi:DNA-binding response OmpR family regulator
MTVARAHAIVLLVERDTVQREELRWTLIEAGFAVLAAADPVAGLEIFRRHPDIDLLVAEDGPALAVVRRDGAVRVVPKPCEAASVVATVRAALA